MAPVDGSPQAPSTAKMAYEALAPAYDDFTHFHDYDLWIANLWPKIEARGIHGKRLLDVACGTGKSFIPLLERGWEVTACDISPAMIEVARAKVGGRATLAVADMRALPRFGEFDLVWCLDDALNYLLDPGDLVRALTGMRANLAPRGLLVFDLNAIGSYRGFFAEEMVVERGGRRLVWQGLTAPDFTAGSIAEARLEGEPLPGSGAAPVPPELHRERHHPEAEVRAALRAARLECLDVWAHGEDAVLEQPLEEERHSKAVYIARAA
ncbi:MAG: class I SAM-dependent methyltransferase [Solirubrobacterales bacterium]